MVSLPPEITTQSRAHSRAIRCCARPSFSTIEISNESEAQATVITVIAGIWIRLVRQR